MNIVCPFTEVAPETSGALAPYDVRYVEMDADDAYTGLLLGLWAQGETFVLVEHDIVPWPGAIEDLWGCPQPWCGFPYPFMGGMHNGLGCCKFGASLVVDHPSTIADTLTESNNVHPRGHWCNLDDRITRQLHRRGVTKHPHLPTVGHVNADRSGHGCVG